MRIENSEQYTGVIFMLLTVALMLFLRTPAAAKELSSTPVQINGLEFVTKTDSVWTVGKFAATGSGSSGTVETIEVLISNKSKQDLPLSLNCFALSLSSLDGKPVEYREPRQMIRGVEPVLIRAGQSYSLKRSGSLICAQSAPPLLTFNFDDGCAHGSFGEIKPGRYKLKVAFSCPPEWQKNSAKEMYEVQTGSEKLRLPFWAGQVQTNPLEITMTCP